MKILLLLPLLLGLSVPAIAHNEFNGGNAMHNVYGSETEDEEGLQNINLPQTTDLG